MSTMSVSPLLTFEEFLAFESESEVKHELIGGVVFAMAGATARHNDVTMNLALAVGPAARASGCRPRVADQLVKIDDINGKYPDFGVYCEPDSHAVFATQPCLLAEVLSPTSHERDKVTKLAAYRRLGSLRAYLVVDPATRTVIAHMRNEAGRWTTTSSGEGDLLMLPCPEMMLAVSDVFQ